MEAVSVVWGGRFVTSSLDPDGCGASISDPITHTDSCAHLRRPSSWDTSVQKAGWKCRDVPGAVVASPSGSSVFRSWLTWAASGPRGMSSFEELFFFWPIWLLCQQQEMAEVCNEGWTPAGWIGRGLKKHGVSPELLPLPWEGFKSPSHCAATLNLNTLGMAKEKRNQYPQWWIPAKFWGAQHAREIFRVTSFWPESFSLNWLSVY